MHVVHTQRRYNIDQGHQMDQTFVNKKKQSQKW